MRKWVMINNNNKLFPVNNEKVNGVIGHFLFFLFIFVYYISIVFYSNGISCKKIKKTTFSCQCIGFPEFLALNIL